ncbi:MAG: rod shape-determining protein MreC [Chitinophagales bacterium]|nr:rod shape-determining protein MreC [Chitinophagales bacterium]
MYNVIQLLIKYGAHILFVVLEIICFTLIVNKNDTQQAIFLNSSNVLAGKLEAQRSTLLEYSNLKNLNDSLLRENATLIENLISIEYSNELIPGSDTVLAQYSLIPTKIINSTINQRNNHFTLNKGSREGLYPGMGVIASHIGLIGIIRNTSDNFAHVISLLNSQTRISCTVKNRTGHGTLVWENADPLRMTLISIPKHEQIEVGDTVITSGYSTMFPRGILVGKIESIKVPPGSNSYAITVKLFNDLTSVKYAYVIQNRFAAEQIKLENEVGHE